MLLFEINFTRSPDIPSSEIANYYCTIKGAYTISYDVNNLRHKKQSKLLNGVIF